jgi:hypothetical protein
MSGSVKHWCCNCKFEHLDTNVGSPCYDCCIDYGVVDSEDLDFIHVNWTPKEATV